MIVTFPINSTWRCHCGQEQAGPPTTYAVALAALRRHQTDPGCANPQPGAGDRIHSKRVVQASELEVSIDREPAPFLFGPPRPPGPRARRAREGLPWLSRNSS